MGRARVTSSEYSQRPLNSHLCICNFKLFFFSSLFSICPFLKTQLKGDLLPEAILIPCAPDHTVSTFSVQNGLLHLALHSPPSKGVHPFGVSGPHWKKSCFGPCIKYANTNESWWAKKKVCSKFMILCWTKFIAVLSCMWPVSCGLDTPVRLSASQQQP